MAISVVGQASAATTSVAIPAHQAGDMIVVMARGTAAAPVVPAAGGNVPAWATLQSGIANSIGLTSAYFVATGTATTTGTWTSATHVCVLVLRPGAGKTLQTAVARSSSGNANNTQSIVYPALTLSKADGTSMGVRVGTRVTAVTAVGTAPTSWTNQTIQPAGASALMSVHTRAALAANPVADTVTTTSSNAASRAHTIEVLEVTTSFGVVARPITFGETVAGTRKLLGQVALPVAFSKAVQGQRRTFGTVAVASFFFANTIAWRKTFGQVAAPFTFAAVAAGDVSTPAAPTYYGVVALPVAFAKAVQGQRRAFGVVARPIVLGEVTQAQRRTFSSSAVPLAFTKAVQAQRRTFGQVAVPLAFSKAVQGRRTTKGVVALPVTLLVGVNGQAITGPQTRFGIVLMPVTFGKAVVGQRKTFGIVARPIVFSPATAARRIALGAVTVDVSFGADFSAVRKAFGLVSADWHALIEVNGRIVYAATQLGLADAIYLGAVPASKVYAGSDLAWPLPEDFLGELALRITSLFAVVAAQSADSFDRANGPLGASWGGPVNSAAYYPLSINGNAVRHMQSDAAAESYWLQSFPTNQQARVRLLTRGNWGDAVWFSMRIVDRTLGAASLYVCNCQFDNNTTTGTFTIYKDSAGSYSNLGSNVAGILPGQILGAKAVGTAISMQVGGATVLTVSDPSAYGAGHVGIGIRSALGVAAVDDFVAAVA